MDIASVNAVLPKQLTDFHIQCVCVDSTSQRSCAWCCSFYWFFLLVQLTHVEAQLMMGRGCFLDYIYCRVHVQWLHNLQLE